jgi:predicted Zn-ribbon and HTH transcriptional regulator
MTPRDTRPTPATWWLNYKLRDLHARAQAEIQEIRQRIDSLGPNHCRNCGQYLSPDDDRCPRCHVERISAGV